MLGLMMQTLLLPSSILMHAARSFPDVEIVSRTPDSPDHITSYSGVLQRSSQPRSVSLCGATIPLQRLESILRY
jgi:hypothetical protein